MLNLRYPLWLGFRALFRFSGDRKRFRGLIGAILGIAFSLVPLLVVLEISGGMIEGITARFMEVGTFHLQVKCFRGTEPGERAAVKSVVDSVPGVRAGIFYKEGIAIGYSPSGKTGLAVRAFPPDLLERDPGFRAYLDFSSGGFDLSDPSHILLSKSVAQELGVEKGAAVKILTSYTTPAGKLLLKPSRFTVAGIFTTGYYELDNLYAIIADQQGDKLFRRDDAWILGVKLEDPMERSAATAELLREGLPTGWYPYTWEELEGNMYESFQTTKATLTLIMLLIVAVAAVNISSSLLMLVMERESEIAILKASGSSPGQIRGAFLVTGMIIGISGAVLGTLMGMAAVVNINELMGWLEKGLEALLRGAAFLLAPVAEIPVKEVSLLGSGYYLEEIPIRVEALEVCGTALFTVFLSILAAYFPARRASRIKPLDILRKH